MYTTSLNSETNKNYNTTLVHLKKKSPRLALRPRSICEIPNILQVHEILRNGPSASLNKVTSAKLSDTKSRAPLIRLQPMSSNLQKMLIGLENISNAFEALYKNLSKYFRAIDPDAWPTSGHISSSQTHLAVWSRALAG